MLYSSAVFNYISFMKIYLAGVGEWKTSARDGGSETGSMTKRGKQKLTTDTGASLTPDFRD